MFGGIGRDRFAVATARKHGPGDAGELVGERDRQQIAVREALEAFSIQGHKTRIAAAGRRSMTT